MAELKVLDDVGGHFKSGQAGPGQNRPVIQ